jgi:hypothetical protein
MMGTFLFQLLITPAFWYGLVAGILVLMALSTAAMLVLGWVDEQAEAAEATGQCRERGLSPRQQQATRSRIPIRNPLITGEMRDWSNGDRKGPATGGRA